MAYIRSSVQQIFSQGEVNFFLDAKKQPPHRKSQLTLRNSQTEWEITKFHLTAQFESVYFYSLPHAFHYLQCKLSVVERELLPILKIEHIGVDEIEPSLLFINTDDAIVCMQFFQHVFHAAVSKYIVETAHTHLMGCAGRMLPIEINTFRQPHLARIIIMYARGVVVAISTLTLVVGKSLMEFLSHHVHPKNAPVERGFECC